MKVSQVQMARWPGGPRTAPGFARAGVEAPSPALMEDGISMDDPMARSPHGPIVWFVSGPGLQPGRCDILTLCHSERPRGSGVTKRESRNPETVSSAMLIQEILTKN